MDLKGTRSGAIFMVGSGASTLTRVRENTLANLANASVPIMCLNHAVFFAVDYHPQYWALAHTDRQDFQTYMRVARWRGIATFPCWPMDPFLCSDNVYQYYPLCEPGWIQSIFDHAMHIVEHLGFTRVVLVGFDGYNPNWGPVSHVIPRREQPVRWQFPDLGHIATTGIIEHWINKGTLKISSAGAVATTRMIPHTTLIDAVNRTKELQ